MAATTVVRLVSPARPMAAPVRQPTLSSLRPTMVVVPLERRPHSLTAREREVLSLLCRGLPNKLIERQLGISAGTVKCHVRNILGKLGVTSRLQAVIEAHRRALVDSPRPDRSSQDAMRRPTMRLYRA